MLTLKASELDQYVKGQNNVETNHQNNDVKLLNGYQDLKVKHYLESKCNDKNLNNNKELPSYRVSSIGESSTQSNCIANDHQNGIVQVEDDDEDNDDKMAYKEDFEIDEDEIEAEENVISEMGGWANGLPVDKIFHESAAGQVLPSLDKTTFGEINIKKSTNVRVGNTTLYKGPVTIKQFVYTNSNLVPESGEIVTDGRISNASPNNLSINKDNSPIFPVPGEYNRVREWLWTWRCAAILCITALVIISTIVVISVTLTKRSELPGFSEGPGPSLDPDDVLVDNVRFIERVDWGAQPAEDKINDLAIIPAPYVVISHTASQPCNTQSECVQRVRNAQMIHIEIKHWSDIAYNFLVGGDGQVYIGRGWDKEGAHAFGYNSKSIGISAIGTFNKLVPPRRQIHALEKLIEIGVEKGKIAKDYKLIAHRQVSPTLSPGDVLYSIIKQWDHWSEKP